MKKQCGDAFKCYGRGQRETEGAPRLLLQYGAHVLKTNVFETSGKEHAAVLGLEPLHRRVSKTVFLRRATYSLKAEFH
jgi:hypothetical protein